MGNRTEITTLMEQWEALWHDLDRLFKSLKASDWERPYGDDWVVADVPYHLAYYDREIMADSLRARDRNVNDETDNGSILDVDAWNAHKFAERPEGQEIEETLEQMRAARQELRDVVAELNDSRRRVIQSP